MGSLIHVAVGVLLDSSDRVLIARRHSGAHQGGLWEFPGGKLEKAESVFNALQREFEEELAVCIEAASPLMQVTHDYGDKRVLLDVWRVERYSGEPSAQEGQPLRWVSAAGLGDYRFPEANLAIVAMLQRDSSLPGSTASS